MKVWIRVALMKKVDMLWAERKCTQSLYNHPTHPLIIKHTHAKGAPLGLHNPSGRDRTHTHGENESKYTHTHTPKSSYGDH